MDALLAQNEQGVNKADGLREGNKSRRNRTRNTLTRMFYPSNPPVETKKEVLEV